MRNSLLKLKINNAYDLLVMIHEVITSFIRDDNEFEKEEKWLVRCQEYFLRTRADLGVKNYIQSINVETLKTEYVETPKRITTAMNRTTIHDVKNNVSNLQLGASNNLETMNISTGTMENEQFCSFKMNNKAKVNVIKFILQSRSAELTGYSKRDGVLAVTSASVERSFFGLNRKSVSKIQSGS